MKWYEKLQNKCKVCNQYLAEELTKETKGYLLWTCRFCGNVRKKIRFWATYKHKNGKVFLKTSENKKFREVELVFEGNRPIISFIRPTLLK